MGLFFLKEDTAVDTKLGPFVDKGDGVAYETGMSAAMDNAATGVRLSKNGGAFADRNEGTAPAYDAFGYYLVKLDATDTNTPGRLKVIFGDAAVCLPCEANFHILHANVFDSLFGAAAADYLQVDTIQFTGTAGTANDNGADINTLITEVGKVPKSDGAVSWNATALAAIEAEALDALEGVQLDHLLGVTTGVAADADLETYCVAGSVMSHVLATGADVTTFKPSTDSLQSTRDKLTNIETDTAVIGALGVGLTAITDKTGNIPASPATSAKQDTAQTDLDTITGTGGVLIGTDAMDRSGTLDVNAKTVGSKTGYALSAAGNTAVIDEFETQAAADPTGFKVNVMEVNGTAQTAGDLAAATATAQTDLDELTDAGTLSGIRLALMLDRIYCRLNHEVNVTDATGAVAIRNAADNADIATGNITDNDTLTQQTVVTWS